MDFDNFDDWEDAVAIGSFFNEMMEEESEEQRRKRKKGEPASDPDNVDWWDSEEDGDDF